MMVTSCWRRKGSSSRMKASTPGFCSPTELSIPRGVSAIRGGGLPSLGERVKPLQQIPPSSDRSKNSPYSRPKPKVPEAATTGFFSRTPASSTDWSMWEASGVSGAGKVCPSLQPFPLPPITASDR